MKKIDFYDYPLGIGLSVWHNMGIKAAKGVDIYQDDDGSIHIFPHKIDSYEANRIAQKFLDENAPRRGSKTRVLYEYPGNKTICVIVHKNNISVGMARLNPSDVSIFHVGRALAYSRASGKKLPAELADYLNIKQ